MKKLEADVIIVGAGLTGSLVADVLSKRGLNVLILERGGEYRPSPSSNWSEEHINIPGTDRWVTVAQDDPWERTEILTDTPNPKYKYNMKFGIGGAGAVWSGAAFRFFPEDFRLRSLHGRGDDWPISYDDLEPWYEKAESELGVSGEDTQNHWVRKSDFPLPAFRASYLDKVFEKYYGKDFPLIRIPAAVVTEPYRGRGACIGAQSCVGFCPTGARYSPVPNHLRAALSRSNCSLMSHALVRKIIADPQTGRIVSLEVISKGDGELAVSAKLFVLACNTVENTRLLLASADERFPNGLANSSNLLGKRFMSNGAFVWRLKFPEKTFPYRGRPITSVSIAHCNGRQRANVPGYMVEIWNHVWGLKGPQAYVEDLARKGIWGARLRAMVDDYMSMAMLTAVFEVLPSEKNTLTLDFSTRDAFGTPLPRSRIVWSGYEWSVQNTVDALLAKQADNVKFIQSGYGLNGNHPYGTYRMASVSKDGVVDSYLRSFDHENLYILGGGSFVTCGILNPTLTLTALALRSAASMRL